MSATLTITTIAGYDAMHELVVDCEHGTTTSIVALIPGFTIASLGIVPRMLAAHDAEKGCSCTQPLWRRYGKRAA